MSDDPASIPDFGGDPRRLPGTALVRPNQELVERLLDDLELKHYVDEDGDLAAGWEGFRVYFMFRGDGAETELYAVRTFYDRPFPIEAKAGLLEVIDEWNRETLWPKVYTNTGDDGVVRLIGEAQMVVSQGVNLDHFTANTVNWIQGSISFDQWLTTRLNLEEVEPGGDDGLDD